ncbi:pyruvate kinase [Asanoa sp. WMMD1127]|uniref:pyruvate kinase n=1 Tax=Asanoa sp. WMMD1127 TaxID=3016107 RepID=UPI0024176770|nr:pyruvate kinase [Asanoa sp. WMMD1127]MDG4821909.1 pyruvate kinase [Asanoa sp. WMMD1127]
MLWYTAGPAASGKEEALVEAGATGVRLGFSYDAYEVHERTALTFKKYADRNDVSSIVVADLPGEKFRLGRFDEGLSVKLEAGKSLRLVHGARSDVAVSRELPVTDQAFFANLSVGDHVVVGDGGALLVVDAIGADLRSAMVHLAASGTVEQSRGLTIQGGGYVPRSLCKKDLAAIDFIANSGCFDAVALSFASNDADIHDLRDLLAKRAPHLKIVAKIETMRGIERLDSICAVSDFVMAARGDLALSAHWAELPFYVEKIAQAAVQADVPWVLATQLVEGLERFSIPTRAEICDIWHWLDSGCAGLMLSYESAFGSKPVEAVRVVRTIADRWKSLRMR